jgi:hypothetical protein
MEEQRDLLADQLGRHLEEGAVNVDYSVFSDPTAYVRAEVIVQISRCGTDHLKIGGEAIERSHRGDGMNSVLMVMFQPLGEALVQLVQRERAIADTRQEPGANGPEEALDLAALQTRSCDQ